MFYPISSSQKRYKIGSTHSLNKYIMHSLRVKRIMDAGTESQPEKTMSLPSRSLQSGEETHTTQTDAKLQLSGALRWRGIWC